MDEAVASPPAEQDRRIVDRLERRTYRRASRLGAAARNFSRSVASDPEDFGAATNVFSPGPLKASPQVARTIRREITISTDADGDDELATNDNEDDKMTLDQPLAVEEQLSHKSSRENLTQSDYFASRPEAKAPVPQSDGPQNQTEPLRRGASIPAVKNLSSEHPAPTLPARPMAHLLHASSATVLYKPDLLPTQDNSSVDSKSKGLAGSPTRGSKTSAIPSGAQTPVSKPNTNASGNITPRRPGPAFARMRPIMPPKDTAGFQSDPNLAGLLAGSRRGKDQPRRSSLELDLVSDLGDNKAIGGGYVGALPASFAAQMAQAGKGHRARADRDEDRDMFGRLMMARMNSLEEGFREIAHEMREHLRRERSTSRSRPSSQGRDGAARPAPQPRFSQLRKETGGESSRGSRPASEISMEQNRAIGDNRLSRVIAE